MSIWDDIVGGVKDVGENLLSEGLAKWVPQALDWVTPGWQEDIQQITTNFLTGGDPFEWEGLQAQRQQGILPGESGSWEAPPMTGIDADPFAGIAMTTGGRRSLVPFTGQGSWPGPGYRLARRPARRPTSGHAGGIYWVPTRTMNPLNPRALKRAIRRLDSASRVAKKLFTWKKSGFHGMKPRARRRRK